MIDVNSIPDFVLMPIAVVYFSFQWLMKTINAHRFLIGGIIIFMAFARALSKIEERISVLEYEALKRDWEI